MAGWAGIVGKSFTADAFDEYCATLKWDGWRPSFIVLHNTGAPNLTQRPGGLTRQHIANLETYYRDQQRWSAGPHLFVDDRQIWVFTSLTRPGVHSPSWNKVSIGIEMLGDFDIDGFEEGRGAAVRDNSVAAIAAVTAALKLDPANLRLHREDPRTTHACPGRGVRKAEIVAAVRERLARRATQAAA